MVAKAIFLILAAVTATEAESQLLCFGASWCAPCREMEPTLAQMARAGYPIRKINVDDQSALARQYRVEAVPSFVLIDGQGKVLDRIDEATSGDTLAKMLAHYRVGPQRPATTIRGQSPPPTASAAKSALELAMTSTVRLQVEDEEGNSFGTGTVIDVHGQEALVLTCGHIFRTSEGKGRILIDRYDSPNAEPTTGSVISYDMDLDIGLVSMKLTRPIRIAKLAPLEYSAKTGEPIFSIGCSSGEPPTVTTGVVNQIDKYLGPPNITASGRPVVGRSGGGLFNKAGDLIGVCSAADPEIDEGLYGALPRVYYELDRNGLSFVYQGRKEDAAPADSSPQPVAQLARADIKLPAAQSTRNEVKPISPIASNPKQSVAQVSHESNVNANQGSLAKDELVCVLKGKSESDSKVFVISNPSKVLLEYLDRESKKK